jgi:peptide/nickel transport system permease protein
VVACALAAPLFIDARQLSVVDATGPPLAPPSLRFPLGTDEAGRSVLTLTVWGSRASLLVGFTAMALAVGTGTLAGLLSAHFGGWAGAALGRVGDWFLVLPQLPFAIALASVLRPGAGPVILAIAATSWAGVARVVRAAVLSVEAQPFLERVRVLGGGHWHQLRAHVLPAITPLVIANAAMTLANAVLTEATLSFLGLGDPGQVSWGSMLRLATVSGAATAGDWWYVLAPGLAIVAVVLAFSGCGRALQASIQARAKGFDAPRRARRR